jgi:hypothetical protein
MILNFTPVTCKKTHSLNIAIATNVMIILPGKFNEGDDENYKDSELPF